MNVLPSQIKAIIGLGNPGQHYYKTRHSIGFRIVDTLADRYGGTWRTKDTMEISEIMINEHKVLLIKPQTFMNTSGKVVPFLLKKGIKPENILVVHDELEQPLGKIKLKFGGSARGHNGLRSIIAIIGKEFARLAFGIDRPEKKEDVSNYVLTNFTEKLDIVEEFIEEAVDMIGSTFA